MAQPSFEFALGRISVLSTHLLSASQLRRIAEAGSTKEAQKLLLETGYGENAATEQELATGRDRSHHPRSASADEETN